MVKEFQPQI